MKCPMLTMYATTFNTPEEYRDRDCLKKECAWWIDDLLMCSIKAIGLETRYTQQRLADLAERLK